MLILVLATTALHALSHGLSVAQFGVSAIRMAAPGNFVPPPPKPDDFVDKFCRGVNYAMEKTVIAPVRSKVQPRNGTKQGGFWATVQSPPELPGLSRPVWLTIAASVPTALGWYG
jgi:hypothetical protein